MAEVIFPKPEGPGTPMARVPLAAPVDDGGRPLLAPPQADGFGVENNYTVTETIDQSGETVIEVSPVEVIELTNPILTWNWGTAGVTDGGLLVPSGPMFSSGNLNLVSREVRYCRFVAAISMTVARIGLLIDSIPDVNADNRIDLGLYNDAGTSKLASTGAIAPGADGPPYFRTYNLTAEVDIVAGTRYRAAVLWDRNTAGAGNFTIEGCTPVAARWGLFDVASLSDADKLAKGVIMAPSYTPAATILPADLNVNVNPGIAHAEFPWFFLLPPA
jgi:hypothetical protein